MLLPSLVPSIPVDYYKVKKKSKEVHKTVLKDTTGLNVFSLISLMVGPLILMDFAWVVIYWSISVDFYVRYQGYII